MCRGELDAARRRRPLPAIAYGYLHHHNHHQIPCCHPPATITITTTTTTTTITTTTTPPHHHTTTTTTTTTTITTTTTTTTTVRHRSDRRMKMGARWRPCTPRRSRTFATREKTQRGTSARGCGAAVRGKGAVELVGCPPAARLARAPPARPRPTPRHCHWCLLAQPPRTLRGGRTTRPWVVRVSGNHAPQPPLPRPYLFLLSGRPCLPMRNQAAAPRGGRPIFTITPHPPPPPSPIHPSTCMYGTSMVRDCSWWAPHTWSSAKVLRPASVAARGSVVL